MNVCFCLTWGFSHAPHGLIFLTPDDYDWVASDVEVVAAAFEDVWDWTRGCFCVVSQAEQQHHPIPLHPLHPVSASYVSADLKLTVCL